MGQYNQSGTNSGVLNPILPAVIGPGDEIYVWGLSYVGTPTPGQILAPNDSNVNFEAVAVGARSLAVALQPRPGGGSPPGLIVQINASADPGATEIDVQDAAFDSDGSYLTPAGNSYKITSWTHNGAVWTAWVELQPESGPFVSLKCITNGNTVKFTAKIKYV